MFTIIRQVNGSDKGPLGQLYRPKYFTWTGIAVHGYTDVPPYPGVARMRPGVERRDRLDLGQQHHADRHDGLGLL